MPQCTEHRRGRRSARAGAPWLLPLALLLPPGTALAAEPMERAAILLERNATDDDAEIRFEITGGAEGFRSMRVSAPDGRVVLDFRAPDSRLGLRSFVLESPEPRNDGRLLADFPVGTYRFAGVTVGGTELEGQAALSHSVPATTAIIGPRPDQRGVPITGVTLRWTAVPNIAGILVVLANERSGQEIRARLPGTATSLAVPNGFLVGGRTYKVEVGTVARDGNRAFVETEFSTAR